MSASPLTNTSKQGSTNRHDMAWPRNHRTRIEGLDSPILYVSDLKAARAFWPVGFSRLTVIHELEGAPIMAGMVASKFSEMGTGSGPGFSAT